MRKEVKLMDGIVGLLAGGFFGLLLAMLAGWLTLPW